MGYIHTAESQVLAAVETIPAISDRQAVALRPSGTSALDAAAGDQPPSPATINQTSSEKPA
jgi:hypothetical protein